MSQRLLGYFAHYECTAYEVQTNEDLNEGRGRTVTLGYFTHKADAVAAGKGRGVFGGEAHIKNVKVDVVVPFTQQVALDPNLEDWGQAKVAGKLTPFQTTWVDPAVAKAAALNKLTPEERDLLGLGHP